MKRTITIILSISAFVLLSLAAIHGDKIPWAIELALVLLIMAVSVSLWQPKS
jgi:hypothetical protein